MSDLGSTSVKVDSILRWAGSKRKVLPRLACFWHQHYDRYVEPFAGSASLFFRLQPASAMLGDINSELIESYEVVRESPDRLYNILSAMPVGASSYYKVRQQIPSKLSRIARAARFIYLNRHCFNGIFRTNKSGQFNVPFGGLKPGKIPRVETFRQCAILLSRAALRTCDFGHILRDTKLGDFVYLDPPYAVESRRVFRQYCSKEFAKKDLERLACHLHRMDARKVHFVLSYADCAEARHFFKDWNPTRMRVRRHVAGFTGSRRTAYELIATNISK